MGKWNTVQNQTSVHPNALDSSDKIKIERSAISSEVAKVVEETGVVNEYNKSVMGRRNMCIQNKQKLNDFGRFKLHYIKGQYKKKVAKEVMTLRAAQKKIDVKELYAQKRRRKAVHPVLRRVVGKFRKNLASRVQKKNMARKRRLRKQKIYFKK